MSGVCNWSVGILWQIKIMVALGGWLSDECPVSIYLLYYYLRCLWILIICPFLSSLEITIQQTPFFTHQLLIFGKQVLLSCRRRGARIDAKWTTLEGRRERGEVVGKFLSVKGSNLTHPWMEFKQLQSIFYLQLHPFVGIIILLKYNKWLGGRGKGVIPGPRYELGRCKIIMK